MTLAGQDSADGHTSQAGIALSRAPAWLSLQLLKPSLVQAQEVSNGEEEVVPAQAWTEGSTRVRQHLSRVRQEQEAQFVTSLACKNSSYLPRMHGENFGDSGALFPLQKE